MNMKNIRSKNKILPDWTFDELVELFDDLLIEYEITKKKNSVNGSIMNIIVYWDYNENKIYLCFDEASGKFIYKIDINNNDIELAEDIRSYDRSINKGWSNGNEYYYNDEEECRKYASTIL